MQFTCNEEETLEAELYNGVVYQCVESDCTATTEMARSGSNKKKKRKLNYSSNGNLERVSEG